MYTDERTFSKRVIFFFCDLVSLENENKQEDDGVIFCLHGWVLTLL